MYTRRLKFKSLNFDAIFGPIQRPTRPEQVHRGSLRSRSKESSSYIYPFSIPVYSQLFIRQNKRSGIDRGFRSWLAGRFYSSDRDGSSGNDGKHFSVENSSSSGEGGIQRGKKWMEVQHCEEHARLGEQDQKEWLSNGIFSFDNQKKDVMFLTKREKFKVEFLKSVIPWEKIPISWDTFPYLISEHTKKLLVECTSSHLKHKKFASTYGARLNSSSGRILLQGIPGTELYRERMVKALAQDLQVPLLVLDSNILAQFASGFSHDSESDADDDNLESEEESVSCSDVEDDTSNEGENDEVDSDENGVDVHSPSEALKKIAPHLEEYGIKVTGDSESESSSVDDKSSTENSTQQSGHRPFRKGDRVKYNGDSMCIEVDGRPLPSGHRGEVYDVNGDKVAVIFDNVEKLSQEEVKNKEDGKPYIWIDIQNIAHDLDIEAQEWYIVVESLCEVLPSLGPIIVYFSDTPQMPRAVRKSNCKEFLQKLEEIFDKLEEPIVLICGKNKEETGSKEKNKLMALPHIAHLGQMPIPLHRLTESFRRNKLPRKDGLHKFFNNILSVNPPKEEDALGTFHKQLDEDRRIIISRNNLVELHRVLVENELSCFELSHVETDGIILTKEKAEQVVGWARNHYLSSCILPSIKDDRLFLPRESFEIGLSRLKELELISNKPLKNMKIIAKDDYEKSFISSVVPANETGVRFEDIGALEDVKMTLNELVTLPMTRPELFSRGNLLRPCKGILLFGPPGTGKTLLAKALATEAGANFVSITGSILTSKWFGDAEKLTKALFSFASRLAPVIIFVDEVDSLLGARGGSHEHEATRRMRNEFMAAWDGLRSKENQRILVLGATNRPFDLDDAVIRRLPRRVYVDLPDAKNRTKILKIFLSQECIEPCFKYDELANGTEGYSGSDLKNLCIAAAYRPVQELLNEEKKEGGTKTVSSLRPLNLNDFLEAKSKVGASVAYDATSMNELRKWNEQYGEGGSRKRSPFGFGD